MNQDVPVKSLKKALDLLSILLFEDRQERGFGVKALADRLGLPANSVHNLLKTMAVCGYVEKNGDGRYTYGNVCRRIAYRNYQMGDDFRERVVEVMRRTVARVDESMVFIVLMNNAWTTLVRAEPKNKIVKVDVEQVERFFIFETATGRVLYSFSSPEKRELLVRENGDPEDFGWHDYEADSSRIRKAGSCWLLRKRYGVYSYAVPVFSREKKLLGAFGIYCPPLECSEERSAFLLANLKQAASELLSMEKQEDVPESERCFLK